MKQDNQRIVYIILCLTGAALSIGACFIPAPVGYLADNSITISQDLMEAHLNYMIIAPAVLMVLAVLLVAVNKFSYAAFTASVIGAAVFLLMDALYAMNYQAFIGVLINAVGCIVINMGTAMQVFIPALAGPSEKNSGEEEMYEPVDMDRIYWNDENDKDQAGSGSEDSFNEMLEQQLLTEAQTAEPEESIIEEQERSNAQFYADLEKMFLEDSMNGGGKDE